MSVSALFLGLEILLWLSIGLTGWLAVTFYFRPRASLLAMAVALIVALVAGPLPGLLGWSSVWGLLLGLLLALVGSIVATWQTMARVRGGE
jgi:uncharacterized membrane protein YeaQ/YmgE (transglycosylase-associated protein family)